MAERRIEDYRYPVYATQGGGLARCVNGTWIFVTDPKCPGLGVGDDVPAEWDVAPANQLAIEEGRDDLKGLGGQDLRGLR